MFDFNPLLASISILTGLSLIFVFRWLGRVKNNYPPGPKGIPVFGNIFQLSKRAGRDFEKWAKKYGDVVYLEVFGHGVLVLNSHAAAVDLLDRRGVNYGDRPAFITVNEFLTQGLSIGMLNYGDLWRKMRRAGHEGLGKTAMSRYYQIQQTEAVIFTENLLQNSSQWSQEVYRVTASGLLSAIYDVPPRLSADDPMITKFTDFDNAIVHTPYLGDYLVEFFPWMKHLPPALTTWKKQAEAGFVEFSTFFMKLFRNVERQMDEGDHEKPGLVGYFIRGRDQLGLSDAEASWLAGTFANSAASTAETLLWFFLAMIAHPEKQKKCQEELDTIVGRSRMPTFEDRDNLPYLRATVRELLRWRPVAPIGTQHVTKEDDWYRGYFIPKGTMCFAHVWLMNRDQNTYGPDANDFNPGRFIDEHGELLPALTDTKDGHVTYGFGPRICPGRFFANDTLFITFARLLWAATISPVVDDQTGKPVIPDLMATVGDGITMRPLPFECVVKPRFVDATEMVTQTKELLG